MQGRNPARFKGGYGVPRGFKGEKSKSPPNPLGLAERVPRPQAVEGVPARSHRKAFPPSPPTGFARRPRPPALPSIAYRGFALAPKPFRPLPKKLARPPAPVSPPQRPPSSREGDRPQAVEGVPARSHRKAFPPPTGFIRRSRPPALPPIAYRGFAVAPKPLRPLPKKLARSLSPRPPSSREGDRPQAVEGVPSRIRWKEFSSSFVEPLSRPRRNRP